MWWDAAAVRLISESQELKQGVADLILPVLSPLDVDKLFSFYPRTVGSRAPRLHPAAPGGLVVPQRRFSHRLTFPIAAQKPSRFCAPVSLYRDRA